MLVLISEVNRLHNRLVLVCVTVKNG